MLQCWLELCSAFMIITVQVQFLFVSYLRYKKLDRIFATRLGESLYQGITFEHFGSEAAKLFWFLVAQ